MTKLDDLAGQTHEQAVSGYRTQKRRRKVLTTVVVSLGVVVLLSAIVLWLGNRALLIKSELESATQLIPKLKTELMQDRKTEAMTTASELSRHTASARQTTNDPLWTTAEAIPWIGANFAATSEIARSADDVAQIGVEPLVKVFDSLDWDHLIPGANGTNLEPIMKSAPSVASAAQVFKASAERLKAIDSGSLLPEIARPLKSAQDQLESAHVTLDAASSAANLAPSMFGQAETRRYILMVQNNAELRASGGIPGALALLKVDKGKVTLENQTSATDLGAFTPAIQVDSQQQQIYSTRLGKFMQDVNLTPDFPTAAATAKGMWETKFGGSVDGVISIDPVALSYILKATGPVQVMDARISAAADGMPDQLTSQNVVKTLLSDVYEKIEDPKGQDAYFAAVAGEIFKSLTSGTGDASKLVDGISSGVTDHRILLWSARPAEQAVLARYSLSGSVTGPSVSPSGFGVYFNDGTGAKMDYYVKRTVQLIRQCSNGGYSQVTVRVTSTNTAPADSAIRLPKYVTGGGAFGVPSGNVQTNIVAYGPTQAHVESAIINGKKAEFGAQRHDDRPVATVTTTVAPGQSSTVEFTFDRIVQHTGPELLVTPTTEPVKNVVLPTQEETCNSGQ